MQDVIYRKIELREKIENLNQALAICMEEDRQNGIKEACFMKDISIFLDGDEETIDTRESNEDRMSSDDSSEDFGMFVDDYTDFDVDWTL